MSMDSALDIVGAAEAAALLGISKGALADRRRASGHRPGYVGPRDLPVTFPEPLAVLACGPVWLRKQILAYQAERDARPYRR